MFVNEGGQLHLVWDTKGQWGSKEEDGYRAELYRIMCEVGYTDN
jgi:hypothetical protein